MLMSDSSRYWRLEPFPVELRLRSAAVDLQRAVLADCVRAAEDPVLPGAEPAEDSCLHAFLAREAQVRLQAGERVRRKARAFLERDAHFVVPVEIVRRDGHQSQPCG